MHCAASLITFVLIFLFIHSLSVTFYFSNGLILELLKYVFLYLSAHIISKRHTEQLALFWDKLSWYKSQKKPHSCVLR